jgi:diguanylate cyclase (GGDEF)-like protein/PAS domain S-box-containing protein
MGHIKQQRINQFFVVYMILIISLMLVTGYYRFLSYAEYEELVSDRIEFLMTCRDVELASDCLTSRARTFVITKDPECMDSYWYGVEVYENGMRELNKIIDATPGDGNLTEDLFVAKQKSDALIQTGAKAMRLVCETLDLNDIEINERTAAVNLNSFEAGLTDSEKIEYAIDAVFGFEYAKCLEELADSNKKYRTTADRYFENEIFSEKNNLRINTILFIAAIFLLVAGVITALYNTYRSTIKPVILLTDSIKRQSGEQSVAAFPVTGSFELRELARAFNSSNQEKLNLLNELRLSEMKLKKHFKLMPLAAIEVDRSFLIDEWNPAAKRIFGYSVKEATGRNIIELLQMNIQRDELEDEIKGMRPEKRHLIFSSVTKNGEPVICKWSINSIVGSNSDSTGWLLIASDITEEKREEERIIYLSWHDPLTDLYNRRYIIDKMEAEIERKKRTGNTFSVVMLDIDNFKNVNDHYGHACGDYVLKKLSRILMETFRKADFVSRWGGEEFLVVLPDTALEGAIIAAEKSRRRVQSEYFLFEGRMIHITISAGVSECRGNSVDMTVKSADDALLEGKRSGKNVVHSSEFTL